MLDTIYDSTLNTIQLLEDKVIIKDGTPIKDAEFVPSALEVFNRLPIPEDIE